MKNNNIIIMLLAMLLIGCSASKRSSRSLFYCGFTSDFVSAKVLEQVNVSNKIYSEKVDSLVRIIVELSLPYKDFTLIEDNTGDVKDAFAYRDNRGRYIVYNRNALESVDLKKVNENPVALGVLAHEIGHLLYGHYGKSTRELEIIADEYSGWVQKKMGVTEINSIAAIHKLVTGDKIKGTVSHPPLNERKKAVERGWELGVLDNRYKYSACCDTSFYSYFVVEGLIFNKTLNEGKTSFVDFTIRTLDNDGKELEVFGGQIIHDQNIRIEDNNEQIAIFKDLGWVIKNRKFSIMQFEMCSCQEPCDGKGERSIRQCRTIQRHVKTIGENLEIPFDKYGFLKIKFSK